MVRLCSPIEAPDREELGIVAMPRFGIPRRESNGRATKVTQVNLRRGLLRLTTVVRHWDYGVGRLFDYLWDTGRVPKLW
jgi:hypothetical protein